MKRLILMRHAKSDWSLGLEDHDRPLNKRGQRSAEAIGYWLARKGLTPDEILCSTSVRTRETLSLLGTTTEPRFEAVLYHAEPRAMLDCLKDARGETVLMIGHNPGICVFAHELLARDPDHPRFEDYPTCATLVAEFEIDDWGALRPGSGVARDFVVPRELI